MKYILIILFAFTVNAQSSLLTLFDSEVVAIPPADTLGINLLANGDMEAVFNGDADWYGSFGATVTRSTGEQVHGGTYSAKTVTAGGGTGLAHLNGASAESGKTYWLEGYYYVVSGNADVQITFTAGGSNQSIVTDTDNAWTYFKLGKTTTGIDDIKITAYEYGGGGNTTFYIDDVTIKELQE